MTHLASSDPRRAAARLCALPVRELTRLLDNHGYDRPRVVEKKDPVPAALSAPKVLEDLPEASKVLEDVPQAPKVLEGLPEAAEESVSPSKPPAQDGEAPCSVVPIASSATVAPSETDQDTVKASPSADATTAVATAPAASLAAKADTTRMKVDHLPKLPKDATQRLRILRESGCMNLERQMYEAYVRLLEANDRSGLSSVELHMGPDCFHGTMNELRPQVEALARGADQRFRIAQRIASSPGQPPEKLQARLDILQRELEALNVAKQTCKAYQLMERLWSLVLIRVRSTIDEQELCRSINPDDIFKTSVPPAGVAEIGRRATLGTVIPQIGAYSPLSRDGIAPLHGEGLEAQEVQYAEEVYLEMKELCEAGDLCMSQVMFFEELMQKERSALEKALPGRCRILRVAAYNRVVKSFNLSNARLELELHKVWKVKTDGQLYMPEGADRVSGLGGKHLSLPLAERAHLPDKDEAADIPRCEDSGISSDSSPVTSASTCTEDNEVLEGEIAFRDEIGVTAPENEELELEAIAEDELVGICVSCIGKQALYVVQECGHLVYCSSCRRKAVARQLNDSEGCTQGSKKGIKPGQLRNKELKRTKMKCPICREEGLLVSREDFGGRIFES